MMTKVNARVYKIYRELVPLLTPTDKYFLLILFILSFIYILPLTLSGVLYDADTARTLSGLFNYHNDARHLSDIIFNIITPGNNAVDLFPYTIMISSLIVSYSGFLILHNFFNLNNNIAKYVFSLSLLINPFFLGNLAFHFDCLPMSLSILFVIYSLIIDKESDEMFYTVLSSIFLFLSLCLYQSSLNIYFLISIFMYFSRWDSGKFKFSDLLKFSGKTSFALITYYFFAKSTIFGAYQVDRSTVLSLNSDFFSNVLTNFIGGMSRIKLVFFSKAGYILILIYILCIVFYLYNQYKKKYNYKRVAVTLFSVLLSIFFIFGWHSFFKYPPRYARNYIAFGAFNMLAIAYLFKFEFLNKFKSLLLVFYTLYLFGISATFANISKFQNNYIQFLSTQLVMDLNELAKGKNNLLIAFSYRSPLSQEYKNAAKGLPILKLLVQRRLAPNWPHYQDFKRMAPYIQYFEATDFLKKIKAKNLQPLIHRKNYSIYKEGDKHFILIN